MHSAYRWRLGLSSAPGSVFEVQPWMYGGGENHAPGVEVALKLFQAGDNEVPRDHLVRRFLLDYLNNNSTTPGRNSEA